MIKRKNTKIVKSALVLLTILLAISTVASAAVVKIGLNYPKTGPYSVQGLAQLRATEMAVEEINQTGGILVVKLNWSLEIHNQKRPFQRKMSKS